jgi:hypothetical protein
MRRSQRENFTDPASQSFVASPIVSNANLAGLVRGGSTETTERTRVLKSILVKSSHIRPPVHCPWRLLPIPDR